MASISDILIAKGAAQANAISQRGNIYADLIKNLGGVPGQLIQDQRRQQMQDLQQREQTQRLGLLSQQGQLNQQSLAKGTREEQQAAGLDALWSDPEVYKPDGTLNRDGILKRAGQLAPGAVPNVIQTIDRLDESRATLDAKQQALAEAQRESLGKDALQLEAAGNDAGLFHLVVSERVKNGIIPKQQGDQLLQLTDPQQIGAVTKQWKAGTASGAPKILSVPEGATPIDERTGKPLEGFTPTKKPPTEAELAMTAAGGDAAGAMALLKPKPQATEEADANRYRNIQARGLLKQPITPEDAAWSKAYEASKTLGVDRTASAAADRQATAISAQTAQQARAQGFQESQVGRKELTDKVEQPYLTAKASAQTLRDTIAAAQGGNVVAGQLQSLEATMAAIRSQGLNRINMSEIATTEHAGSLWQNIEGWLGKKAEGQPIPASVQKDMLEFAGILDKAADKKYQDGFDAVTKRYGLKDEKPLVQNAAQAAPASPLRSKAASVLQQNGFSADPSSIDTFLKNNPAFK